MPEICTCGAQLPPDALFCHKCGKPQRKVEPEESAEEKAETPAAPEVSNLRITPAPAPLDFRNPIAVRIALTMATITTLLSWMPLLNIALWVASGFFAVYFYRRRTGDLLTVRNGMRMGWITGVLTFAITTLVFTATMIPMAFSGGLGTLFRNQFKNFPSQDPNMEQALRMIQSPQGMAVVLLVTLAMLFVFITSLAMAGGALGAKMIGRHSA